MSATRASRQLTPAVLVLITLLAARSGAADRRGAAPDTPWSCPDSHPIKGYVSRESGRHVYYVPGHRFYEEASPERCYASEDEARDDGSRPAGSPRVPAGDSVDRWEPSRGISGSRSLTMRSARCGGA